jgi:indole-3-glycerol phosphate synthase
MILKQILADCLANLEVQKLLLHQEEMRHLALSQSPPLNFAQALKSGGVSLIAEVKKASPSQGVIKTAFDPVTIARCYASSGVTAISVLTESEHFKGSLDYLQDINRALGEKRPPLLRKDFILEPYQVYQSRAYGADSLLLIAAILTLQELRELLCLSDELGMYCLVEVRNQSELDMALKSGADIIGINNRNLDTFNLDINTTRRLRPLIPKGKIVVSESGIKGPNDMKKMRKWGVDAVLVGEWLMVAKDISSRIKELMA